MTNFTPLEMFILNNLRDSLEKSFAQALEKFGVGSLQFLAVSQRLTISVAEREALRAGQLASATVEVTDFLEKRRSETVYSLIMEYNNFTDEGEDSLWVAFSMLFAEGLVYFDGVRGELAITKAGLAAVRESQVPKTL